LRAAGIADINVDLIAGLPYQTAESWEFSSPKLLLRAFLTPVFTCWRWTTTDSRLGRELMAGGTRYHAHFVPDEELTADM